METKDILYSLRTQKGYSQDELAEIVHVTRQAVSRWETGDTIPNIDTLKLLSKCFDVSINTLLGSPRELICQCCGMPLHDGIYSKETDGFYNEDYCKWCYVDGEYQYDSLDDLIENCIKKHVPDHQLKQVRLNLKQLNYWKRYESLGGTDAFDEFKSNLMNEVNGLRPEGMPEIASLNALAGHYVNFEYLLPNGHTTRFLDDQAMYLGTQVSCLYNDEICFGVVANMDFILICSYEAEGHNPELLIYRKR